MSSNSYENNFDSKKWIPPLKQQSKSYWFLHSNRGYDFQRELGKFAPLSNTALPEFDVCVIGAGITGLTCAAELKQAGKRVAVLEAGFVACGTTGYSTGHLTNVCDTKYTDIEKRFGKEQAKLVHKGMSESIDYIESSCKKFNIDCAFERLPGILYNEPEEHQDKKEVPDEIETMQKLNLGGVKSVEQTGLPFKVEKALFAPNQGQFNPAMYCRGLADFVHGDGCQIFINSRVKDIKNLEGDLISITTDLGAKATFRSVVMATHTPIGLHPLLQTRLFPMRSYATAIRVSNPPPVGLYWDTADPYNYIRSYSSAEQDVLIIGGMDHKTGDPNHSEKEAFERLRKYCSERFQIKEILTEWSSQYYETPDGLPFIGLVPSHKNLYFASGFLGDGLTWGTLAGKVLSDLILGKENEHASLYQQTRIKLGGTTKLVEENFDVMKRFVADRFAADAKDLSEISNNCGALVQCGTKKVAAYRDNDGKLHLRSAVCPHMACIVRWNDTEVSWDCPCHGSRFSVDGKVLEGPALIDLEDLTGKLEKEVGKDVHTD